jgi:tRNA A-37 threonylcarbamoyl transferase component Bud32
LMRMNSDAASDAFRPDLPAGCDRFTHADMDSIAAGDHDEDMASAMASHLADCEFCRQRFDEILRRPFPGVAAPLEGFAGLDPDEKSARLAARLRPRYPRPRDFEPGDVIGPYEILDRVGKGGSSVVYECLDHRMGRRVAVKVLVHQSFDESRMARLEREARTLAQLDHPGIVRAYEIDTCYEPPFIVMELVTGGSSQNLLADGPMPPLLAARAIADVAEALHDAHMRGIVHRDIKPSNLLVVDSPLAGITPASDAPRLKITDFGLARDLKSESGLTSTGAILGTPAYMSPEQTRGGEIGLRSDIYSLGAVLYEFLIGRPPLAGGSAVETLRMIQDEEPVTPRAILPIIPVDLETICLKCLRKKPEERYGSARELAEDLNRFLEGRPIMARPLEIHQKLWRWARRNRSLAVALGCSALLATALTAASVRFAIVQGRLRREADANAARAETNAKRLAATAQELLIESDQTRNFMFTGIQNLEEIARNLANVTDEEQARSLSEKARTLNDAAVERYLTRTSVKGGNLKGEKLETLFRDGHNLIIFGVKDQGLQVLDRIRKMALASRPGDPDFERLRKLGTLSDYAIARERTSLGQKESALDSLIEAWQRFGFDPGEPGLHFEDIYLRKIVLDEILKLTAGDEPAISKLTAADRARIEAESNRLAELQKESNP